MRAINQKQLDQIDRNIKLAGKNILEAIDIIRDMRTTSIRLEAKIDTTPRDNPIQFTQPAKPLVDTTGMSKYAAKKALRNAQMYTTTDDKPRRRRGAILSSRNLTGRIKRYGE